MSALTSIFNFLYVFLRAIFAFIVGSHFSVSDFSVAEQRSIARQILFEGSNGLVVDSAKFTGEPILLLVIGVFALGSIISLARRLIKG